MKDDLASEAPTATHRGRAAFVDRCLLDAVIGVKMIPD
jgi:hypothetical protein